MTQRPMILLGTAALLAQLLVVVGCSSSDTPPTSPGTGGAGGVSVMTGTGGSTGSGGTGANPDVNCTSTNAKSGMSCTVDCTIPCGYQGLGTKICTCGGGVYTACPCPAPVGWAGLMTADYCVTADGTGTTTTLKNAACTTAFEECIGKDAVTGTTPQGCVCLNNPTTSMLQWYCGSTNKWFALATAP